VNPPVAQPGGSHPPLAPVGDRFYRVPYILSLLSLASLASLAPGRFMGTLQGEVSAVVSVLAPVWTDAARGDRGE
jgi:hypothetical protein